MEQEQWVVRSEKGLSIIYIVIEMMLIYVGVNQSYDIYKNRIDYTPLVIIMWTLFIIYIARSGVEVSKILILTRDGCEMKLFCFHKFYYWDELVVKRLEDDKRKNSYKYTHYDEAVLFSPVPVRKPKWLGVESYCLLFHPWKCFYLYIFPEGVDKNHTRLMEVYAVEKQELADYMNRWNVKIEGLNDKTDE